MASVFPFQNDRFFVLLECFFKHAKGSSKVFYIQIVVIVLNLCTLMLLSQSLQLLDLELQQRVVLQLVALLPAELAQDRPVRRDG